MLYMISTEFLVYTHYNGSWKYIKMHPKPGKSLKPAVKIPSHRPWASLLHNRNLLHLWHGAMSCNALDDQRQHQHSDSGFTTRYKPLMTGNGKFIPVKTVMTRGWCVQMALFYQHYPQEKWWSFYGKMILNIDTPMVLMGNPATEPLLQNAPPCLRRLTPATVATSSLEIPELNGGF